MILAAWARLAGAATRAASTINAARQERALNEILVDTTTLLVVAHSVCVSVSGLILASWARATTAVARVRVIDI